MHGVCEPKPASDVRDRVVKLRTMIRDSAGVAVGDDRLDPLRSVFLIGSCSDEVPDDWYQDFDIHFLFDGLALRPKTLAWLADLLQRCRDLSGGGFLVEAHVKDRHWKMVPDRSRSGNVGVHATLLNSADHFRRVHVNPILAANMYVRCGVVYGDHPADVRGWRPVGAAAYTHSVGGIGWLAENFARAVSLYVLTPDDHSFYPFIGGYTWNIASSALFHLYSLVNGRVTSRKGALEYFRESPDSSAHLREAARLLYEYREDPSGNRDFGRRQINAAGRVLGHVASRLKALVPAYYDAAPTDWTPTHIVAKASLYGGPLDGLASSPPEVVDVLRDEREDYYTSVQDALAVARRAAGSEVSSKENFEFVRDLVEGKGPATKVRVWDSASLPRRLFSDDYSAARGSTTESDLFFGWEDGLQTLLQRLHEVCIELGPGGDGVAALARVTAAIASDRLGTAGVAGRVERDVDNVFAVTEQLAGLLRPHVVPVSTPAKTNERVRGANGFP